MSKKWVAAINGRARQRLYPPATTNAREALAQLRYVNGLATYLDVLDAQRQLFDAEIGLTRTRRAQLVALVQVYKSLGGGWNAP